MGIKLSGQNYGKLLFVKAGCSSPVVAALDVLVSKGVVLHIGFYDVTMNLAGAPIGTTKLPCITTALLKGTPTEAVKDVAAAKLSALVADAYSTLKLGPMGENTLVASSTPTLAEPPAWMQGNAPQKYKKSAIDTAGLEAHYKNVMAKKKAAAPVANPKASPVLLRDATAIFQKVRGTSQSSIYEVIAVSSQVKVAARVKHGAGVSVRAEGEMTAGQRQALVALGMKDSNSGHLSLHLQGVPSDPTSVAKVFGSLLFGLQANPDLLTFDQVVDVADVSKVKGA